MTKFTHKASGSVVYGTITARGIHTAQVTLDGTSEILAIQESKWEVSRELPTHDGAVIGWPREEWPSFARFTGGRWETSDGDVWSVDVFNGLMAGVDWVEYKPVGDTNI